MPLGVRRCGWKDNLKMHLKEVGDDACCGQESGDSDPGPVI